MPPSDGQTTNASQLGVTLWNNLIYFPSDLALVTNVLKAGPRSWRLYMKSRFAATDVDLHARHQQLGRGM